MSEPVKQPETPQEKGLDILIALAELEGNILGHMRAKTPPNLGTLAKLAVVRGKVLD